MPEQIGLEAVLKLGDFTRSVATYNTLIGKMNTQTDSAAGVVGKGFLTMGNAVIGFSAVAGTALLGATAAVGGLAIAIGGLSAKVAINFESAWAGVIKTTDGLTDGFGNLTVIGQELQDGFRNLAKETPLTVEELMRIGELGGQLGISNEYLLSFTETIAAMGVTTNITTEEAAQGFAQFANIMQTSEKDISRMGSTIVELGNNLATTERDIFDFALRIAGAGEIAGLTEANVFAISAAFTSVGIEAEAGGTAVQKVLLAMTEAVQGSSREAIPEFQDALSKIQEAAKVSLQDVADAVHEGGTALDDLAKSAGVSAEEVTTALNLGMASPGSQTLRDFAKVAGVSAEDFKMMWEGDAATAFKLFVEGLGTAGDDAIGILEDLGLTDQRLVRSFLSLSNAGDLLAEALDMATEAWGENSALTDEAAIRYATASSLIKILKNNIKDLGITVGSAFLPVIRDVIKILKPLIQSLGDLLPGAIEKHLVPVLQNVVKWLGDNLPVAAQKLYGFIKDKLIPIISTVVSWFRENIPKAIAFVVENITLLKGAFMGIGTVLAGAGIVAAIASVIAAINPISIAIAGIIALAGLLGAAWATNWNGIRDKTIGVIEFISPYVTEFVNNIILFWNGIRDKTIEVIEWLLPYVTGFVELIKYVWQENGQKIIDTVIFMWDTIKTSTNDAIAFISSIATNLLMRIRDWWLLNGEEIIANLTLMWELIKSSFYTSIEEIRAIMSAFFIDAKSWWDAHSVSIATGIQIMWETIKITYSNYLMEISGILQYHLGTFSGWWAEHGGSVEIIVSWFLERVRQTYIVGMGLLSEIVTFYLDAISSIFSGHGDTLSGIINNFFSMFRAIWEGELRVIGNIIDAFAMAIEGDWYAFGENLRKAFDNTWSTIGEVVERYASIIIDVFTAFKDAIVGVFQNENWSGVGGGIIEGIKSGIQAASKALALAAITAAKNALEAVKGFLGIKSPSKEFEKIGYAIGEGMAIGIGRSAVLVQSALGSMIGGAGEIRTGGYQGSNLGDSIVEAIKSAQKSALRRSYSGW